MTATPHLPAHPLPDPTVPSTLDPGTPAAATLALAARAIGLSEPNPRVGCVIVPTPKPGAPAGTTFEGHTQAAGSAHAEVMALRAAQAVGADVRGATVYVSLEPCAHHGRTPPCCDALVQAGVGRVVAALQDPNPLVAGQGLARLRAAGIEVQLAGAFTGAFAHRFAQEHPGDPDGRQWALAARELNLGFLSRMVRQRPWVRLKVAASLDGQTALADGTSQWITQAPARADGHAWRRRAGALLTGQGTVRDDDPRLDVRLVPTAVQPLRVVVDSRLDTPVSARILQPPGRVRIYATAQAAAGRAAQALMAAHPHAQVVAAPEQAGGKTDLAWLLHDLAREGVNELHVEAGHKLNGSLLRAGLVDELLVYLAPRLLGAGLGMADLGPLAQLGDALEFEFQDTRRVGADLRLRARPPGRADFQPADA